MNLREIKFRAWEDWEDKLLPKKMYKWNEIKMWNSGAFKKTILKERDELTLMQFTGLKDNKGVEIYEGDIGKTKAGNVGVIRFIEGKFVLAWDLIDDDRYSDRDLGLRCYYKEFEVIGNIFENPELLRDKVK